MTPLQLTAEERAEWVAAAEAAGIWPSKGVCQRVASGSCSPCFCETPCTHDWGFNPTPEFLAFVAGRTVAVASLVDPLVEELIAAGKDRAKAISRYVEGENNVDMLTPNRRWNAAIAAVRGKERQP